MGERPRAPILGFALLSLSCAAAARLSLAPLRILSPDEAYYLCAARSGWPIVDHPPLLGALLTLTDRLPLPLETRVRVVAVVLQTATALLIGLLAAEGSEGAGDEAGEDRARRFTFAVFLSTWGLMPWVAGLITTPDAPLLAATAGALLFARRRARVGLLLCVALAVSAKATGLLVAGALALDLRARDRVGAAVALLGGLLVAPLAWPSLVAQVGHALGRGGLVSAPFIGRPAALGALLGGVLLLFGPAACWLAYRGRDRLGSLPGATPLVVGLSAATVASALVSGRAPEPNWIAPAFVPLFAIAVPRAGALLALHVAPAVVGIVAWLTFGSALPLSAARDPLARLPLRGHQPADSLALPPYARPAWACLYEEDCRRIRVIFSSYNLTLKAGSSRSIDH